MFHPRLAGALAGLALVVCAPGTPPAATAPGATPSAKAAA
jgi:hypothetical protein